MENLTGNDTYTIINILNSMYNDNIRQMDNLTETLNNLNNSNNQIRNLLIQIINNNRQTINTNRVPNRNRNRANNSNINNNNANRIVLNNIPYVVESYTEYTIPNRTRDRMNNLHNPTTLFNNFMQPVEVYPTQTQIESATRRVRYCDISRPINSQCPISIEDFNDSDMVTVIRPCGHIFHTEHLMNWFRTNCRCPLCRYDIRDFHSNASTEFYNNSSINNNSNNNDASNNTERNNLTRMNSTDSNRNNTNSFSNLFYDSYNDIMNNYTDTSGNLMDLSGNYIDQPLFDTNAMLLLLNTMNRFRNI
jgi:hypothetical protein